MKKKEILIISLLAILATGLSLFFIVSGGEVTGVGFPLSFINSYRKIGYVGTVKRDFSFSRLVFDFLFWLLVILGVWRVLKWRKKKIG